MPERGDYTEVVYENRRYAVITQPLRAGAWTRETTVWLLDANGSWDRQVCSTPRPHDGVVAQLNAGELEFNLA